MLKMGGFLKIVSAVLKALNYEGKGSEEKTEGDNDGEGSRRRPPSAPSQRKPPIIRIRRERSLNGVQWGSPQQQLSTSENNLLSVTKPSTKVKSRQKRRSPSNEVPKFIENVITTSASYGSISRPIERQVIRIINGANPSVQSQVLLNTKTSQPWNDLVRDLGMAVKISKRKVGNRMETLTGRLIQSYSQLRSELKVGNQAFYVYSESDDEDLGLLPNLQRHRLSVSSINNNNPGSVSRSNSRARERKKSLVKTTSVSSDLSSSDPYLKPKKNERQRRRSQTRSPNSRTSRSHNPSPTPSRSPSPGIHRLPLPQIV